MKPFFIDDWPRVKKDHDVISKKIISLFEEHQKNKAKSKELDDNISVNNDSFASTSSMSSSFIEDIPAKKNLEDNKESLLSEGKPVKRKNSKL